MFGQPGARCIQRTIWQQDNRPATLQVANNRAVGLPALESEVVDSDDRQRVAMICDPPSDDAQQCVFADRYHETICKNGCRSAAQSQTEMVHNGLEPLRAPAIPGQNVLIKALAKNATAAKNAITPKPTGQAREFYPSTTKGSVTAEGGMTP